MTVGLVVVSVMMLATAALILWMARRAAAGTLPRNDFAGIRTAATRSSDEAWIAAHRAGAADLRRSVVGAAIAGTVPWVSLALPESAREPVAAAGILAGAAVLVAFSVRAAIVGQRAALAVIDRR
ncbi:predicted integral membrane protein [Microbacterium testaceum StLB037]|uniref:Predicted integral membrane protein n=1 Tax=Microbacterium testaceum (strain StLB037) TaxID=979556 RepID=E8NAS8_MICTS|nr:SdpI family protein [Microbacterium testaceum]BAJ75945.1 predicted integral membrane protein [Microbacterium testaceum StLB037]